MPTTKSPLSRRDRPAKPPLSRDGIIAAALRILSDEDLERVTMRRLAQELDTGAASLYVYVSNLAELHGAILDALLGSADLGALRPPRQDQLVEVLVAYTELLFAYPSLARSVLMLRPIGPHYLGLVDRLLTLLRLAGVAADRAAWGVDLLLQHATATAAEHGTRATAAGDLKSEQDGLSLTFGEVEPAEYPGVAWAHAHLLSGTGVQRLRWSFAALIYGIAATPTAAGEQT